MVRLLMAPSSRLWSAFVESSPDAGVFHHPAWIQLLADCYGYRSFILAVCDDTGQLRAGLPVMEIHSPLKGRRWVALPFTDHCAPLSTDTESLYELLAFLADLQEEGSAPRLELRSALPSDIEARCEVRHVLHLLRLSRDVPAVLRTFKRTLVQNRIRKAEREGINVRWASSRRDLETFYILHWQTRWRLGVPLQPKRYFDMLWQRMIEPGLGFILLAYKDAVPVAGGVFLAYKTTLMYKYGASDSAYWPLSPNHLLFWTAIRWGCEHGYTVFDWGKTEIDNEGLRNFKCAWGTQEIPLAYSTLPAPTSRLRLPIPIARRMVPLSFTGGFRAMTAHVAGLIAYIIRHSPPSVCRTSGELFYRYFA